MDCRKDGQGQAVMLLAELLSETALATGSSTQHGVAQTPTTIHVIKLSM